MKFLKNIVSNVSQSFRYLYETSGCIIIFLMKSFQNIQLCLMKLVSLSLVIKKN